MAYFFGLIMWALGALSGCFAIQNMVDTEVITILNVTMTLCTICALGFAGILFSMPDKPAGKKSKRSYFDDED